MRKEGPLSGFAGNDRFVLHRALGSGAFGTVYEAFDVQAERTVALKTLHALTPDTLYRFKREFRALNDLEHPNLVRLYDLLQVDGTWLFTMELLQGATFLDYVRPFGKLDADRLRRALAQLADGLEALHATGHLHRDIKPSNVLVTHADERLVLLDFGLVTDDDPGASRDGLGGIVGTPAYMAPEQAGQQALSPAADWYAVGAMLFEALTGRPPFEGKAMKILVDKMRQDAPAPGTLRRVPADLDNLCRALLARAPDERPAAQRVRAWALGAAVATPAASVEQAPIFVGRADERAALDDGLADARRGRPALAHLVGPSGVGKSALLQAFLRDARETPPAPLVLHSRCYARESVP